MTPGGAQEAIAGRERVLAGSGEAAVWASALSRSFGDERAVRNVSFEVSAGSIFGYIGPSGSGKTTTIRLFTGLLQPTSGRARVLGQDPLLLGRKGRRRIGYMPQLFSLYPELSVRQNLRFSASMYGVLRQRRRRMAELLDFVELREHQGKLARELSGGMQRRLSLAATLVHDPELLFLDEPTAGIDPILRDKFWDHLRTLRHEGRTLFITTQYVSEAAYCDRVGIMDRGRLVAVDTPENLRRRAFGGDLVDLRTQTPLHPGQVQELTRLPFVSGPVTLEGDRIVHLAVDDAGKATPALVQWAGERDVSLDSVNEHQPAFDEVFLRLVEDGRTAAGEGRGG